MQHRSGGKTGAPWARTISGGFQPADQPLAPQLTRFGGRIDRHSQPADHMPESRLSTPTGNSRTTSLQQLKRLLTAVSSTLERGVRSAVLAPKGSERAGFSTRSFSDWYFYLEAHNPASRKLTKRVIVNIETRNRDSEQFEVRFQRVILTPRISNGLEIQVNTVICNTQGRDGRGYRVACSAREGAYENDSRRSDAVRYVESMRPSFAAVNQR